VVLRFACVTPLAATPKRFTKYAYRAGAHVASSCGVGSGGDEPGTWTVTTQPSIRRGRPDDAEACHEVLWASVTDLGRRNGTPLHGSAGEWWAAGESLQRFLADHAAEWWVAEESGGGALIGYARSVERGGLLELTEFFVAPGRQSAGLGQALLHRAFPVGRGEVRSIIATTDVRALSRYYRADTVARFPMLALGGAPAKVSLTGDLAAEPIDIESVAVRRALRDIDTSVLEYSRDEAEIRWLLTEREGFLYRRGSEAVGFAFVGHGGVGPVAVLDAADLPTILLHVEGRAFDSGVERLDFQVPAPNEVATRHLLGRGFRLDPWMNLLMSNRPFGRFDRLVSFGPPVFL
jgi:GNAT superfamily N-acetyltransferase